MHMAFKGMGMVVTAGALVCALPLAAEEKNERIFTFTGENDALTQSGDRYYTNGVRFSWLDTGSKVPDWVRWTAERVPMFRADSATVPLYSVGHNLYTPHNIKKFAAQPNDRPYAGFLYGSVGLSSGSNQKIDDVELMVGVVGPSAQGEFVQRKWHDTFGYTKPNGWEHQLEDEPALNVAWQRRWPRGWETQVGEGGLNLMPYVGVAAGNVYTHAGAGATLNWRSDRGMSYDTPLRVRPAMPGTGYFSSDTHLRWRLFGGVEERVVARNIFLDGNSFQDGPRVRKKNLVTDVTGGVSAEYRDYAMGYTLVYRTKEFFGQDKGELFGALTLSRKF